MADIVDPFRAAPSPDAASAGAGIVDPFAPKKPQLVRPTKVAEPTERTWGEVGTDTVKGIGSGLASLVGGTLSLVEQANPINGIKRSLAELGGIGSGPTTYAADATNEVTNYITSKLSPTLQRKKQELADTKGFWNSAGKVIKDPALLGQFAAEQIPNLATLGYGTAATGTRAALGATEALAARGVGEAAIAAGGKKAAEEAGKSFLKRSSAVLEAADANQSAIQDARSQPQEVWDASPKYQELRAKGLTDEAAKNLITSDAGLSAALISAPLGYFGGAISAPFESKLFTGGLEAAGGARSLLTRAGVRQTGAAIGAEAAEETVQEGGNQLGVNVGAQSYDPNRPLMQGVPEAAAIGGTLGAVLGGGMSVAGTTLQRPKRPDITPDADLAPGDSMTRASADLPDPVAPTGGATTPAAPDSPIATAQPQATLQRYPGAAPGSLADAVNTLPPAPVAPVADVLPPTQDSLDIPAVDVTAATDAGEAAPESNGRQRVAPLAAPWLNTETGEIAEPTDEDVRGLLRQQMQAQTDAGGSMRVNAKKLAGAWGLDADRVSRLRGQVVRAPFEQAMGEARNGPTDAVPAAGPVDANGAPALEPVGSVGERPAAIADDQRPAENGAGADAAADTAAGRVARSYDESEFQLDDDIGPPSGGPFINEKAADLAAKRHGEGAKVFTVDGGYVVRTPSYVPADADGKPIKPSKAKPEATAAEAQKALDAVTQSEPVADVPAGDAAVPVADSPAVIDEAAHAAATSPLNDLPEPTDAQKEAGNYQKGHVNVNGLDVSIENPAGSKRRPEWPDLAHHYGYIKGTTGADKDHVDVFLTNDAADASRPVFVIDQTNKDGTFDEHKVILGAADEASARKAYLDNYEPGWNGLSGITQMTQDEFKAWVKDPAQTTVRTSAEPAAAAAEADVDVPFPVGAKVRGKDGRLTRTGVVRNISDMPGHPPSRFVEWTDGKAGPQFSAMFNHELTADEAKPRKERADAVPPAAEVAEETPAAAESVPAEPAQEEAPERIARNEAERARVDRLPPDQRDAEIARLRSEIRTDDLTGLLNAKAYRQDDKAGELLPHFALLDLDLFKGYNDLLGYDQADAALVAFGKMIAKVLPAGKNYRRGGDEFVMTANTLAELDDALTRLHNLAGRVRMRITAKSGESMIITGIPHSAGVGTDEATANAALDAAKAGKPSSRSGAQPQNIGPERVRAEKPEPARVPESEPVGQGGNLEVDPATVLIRHGEVIDAQIDGETKTVTVRNDWTQGQKDRGEGPSVRVLGRPGGAARVVDLPVSALEPASTALTPENGLFVRMGGKTFQVDSFAEASDKFKSYLAKADESPIVELAGTKDGPAQAYFTQAGDIYPLPIDIRPDPKSAYYLAQRGPRDPDSILDQRVDPAPAAIEAEPQPAALTVDDASDWWAGLSPVGRGRALYRAKIARKSTPDNSPWNKITPDYQAKLLALRANGFDPDAKLSTPTPSAAAPVAKAHTETAPPLTVEKPNDQPVRSVEDDRPEAAAPAPIEPAAAAGNDDAADRVEQRQLEEAGPVGRVGRIAPSADEGALERADAGEQPEAAEPQSDDGGVSAGRRAPARAVASPSNFTITDELDFAGQGPVTKFNNNVAAIRLLQELEATGRQANAAEQSVLARYAGWGGIPQAFDERKADWADRYKELKALLDPREHAAAARSTQDAHYTSATIVNGIWDAVKRLGFDGGRVLEPSMGTGNFFGLMPHGLRSASRLTGVELDGITGRIAKQLYQKADVQVRGFNDLRIAPDSFDIAVGNPPFGAQQIFDKQYPTLSKFSIHNFFFAKSVASLRPGGVLAMVVSSYFMDAQTSTARQWIGENARLLGAIRLPNTAFKQNAGTEVVTDIVFLQRLGPGIEANPEAWLDLGSVKDAATGNQIPVNRYFAKNPAMMLGDMALTGSMRREGEATLNPRAGTELGAELAAAIATLPTGVFKPASDRAVSVVPRETPAEAAAAKVYGYFFAGDKLMQRQPDYSGNVTAAPVALEGTAVARLRGMIGIRDLARSLLAAELDPATKDKRLEGIRKNLNEAYDSFVKEHGALTRDVNKRLYRDDPDGPLLLSLEREYDRGVSSAIAKKNGIPTKKESAKKADIFTKRTNYPVRPVESVSDAGSALLASLNEKGRFDYGYISRIYPGKTEAEVVAELGDRVFIDPADGVVTSDAYLSGNVKAKLEQAREAAKADRSLQRNVTALEKVIPPDVDAVDIFVRTGTPWIPASDFNDFARETFEGTVTGSYIGALGRWVVSVKSNNPTLNVDRWGTSRMTASELMEAAMTNAPVVVYDKFDDGSRVLNQDATAAAKGKAAELEQAFQDWVWKDDARRERLSSFYNDTYNTSVTRSFDGSHMTFPGMNRGVLSGGALRPHQGAFAYRVVQDGKALADHVVGAGKTYAAIAGVMEKRRLGLARKPMITVPNHLVDQWAGDFLRLYPGANVLAASRKDFEGPKRRTLFSRIATGDWDAVIVAHSSFQFIPLPADYETKILQDQVNEILAAEKSLASSAGKKDRSVKELEKRREALQEKIKRLSSVKRDDILDFAEMGVDDLTVDEAHEFKNLFFVTTQRNVAGLGSPEGSKKAFDMFVKTQFLQERNAGKGVVFLTGTPVSNTLSEVFHMSRYLQYDELQQRGIRMFDSWAGTFGSIVSDWEMDAAGRFKEKARFSKFANLPELRAMWGQVTDTVTRADLQRDAAAQGQRFPLPKIKGGKPENVVVQRSEQQAAYIGVPKPSLDAEGKPQFNPETGVPIETYDEGTIIFRMEHMPKDPSIDNFLKATGDARKAGLDFRLVDSAAPDFAGSKINRAVAETVRIYKANAARKGTQLMFCDLSVPASARGKATEAATARIPSFFERSGDQIKHVAGKKVKLSAMPERAFFYTDEKRNFRVYEAGSGQVVARGTSRQDAIDAANAELAEDAGKWAKTFYDKQIDPATIEAYLANWEAEQEAAALKGGTDEDETAPAATINLDELLADQSDFSVYDDVKAKLIAAGIPAAEVQFIHDYSTDLQKADLFAKVNRGDIRVLLGSTSKMGAGMNVQKKLVALHHLDAPWRPSDLEQREGRIIRQGNEFYEADPDGFEIEIYRYATSQTYDARQWEIIERKAASIEQFKADKTVREIEDVTSEAANAADMKGSASGNPLILESVKLRQEVKVLDAQERAHQSALYRFQSQIRAVESKSAWQYGNLEKVKAAVAKITPAEPWALTIDGKTFTDKKAMKPEPMLAAFKKAVDAKAKVRVGSYRGLDIYIEPRQGSFDVELATNGERIGATNIEVTVEGLSVPGFLTRLENMAKRGPDLLAAAELGVKRVEREADQAREEVKRGFPKEAELTAKRARMAAVVQALRSGKREVEGDTAAPVTDEAPKPTGMASLPALKGTGAQGLTFAAARRQVAELIEGWDGDAPKVIVHENADSLPDTAALAEGYGEDASDVAEGFYDGATGTVHLVASNIHGGYDQANKRYVTAAQRLEQVLRHEAVGHYAIEAITGPGLWYQIGETLDTMRRNGNESALFAEIDRRYPGVNRLIADREAVAVMAEKGVRNSVMDRVVTAFRSFWRSLGFHVALSQAELRQHIVNAARHLRNGVRPRKAPSGAVSAFSKADPTKGEPKKKGRVYTAPSAELIDDLEKVLAPEQQAGAVARAREWLKDLTPGKIKDTLRSTWLGGLTLRHLAELGNDYLPGMQRYMDFVQRMGADRNQFQAEADGVATPLQHWAGKNRKEAVALARIQHDATIAGVDPAEAYKMLQFRFGGQLHDATPKLVKEALAAIREQALGRGGDSKVDMIQRAKEIANLPKRERARVKAYPALVARWNALSPEAQQFYKEQRDLYLKRSAQMEEALIERIQDDRGSEKEKRNVIDIIRYQFESQRLQGVYFPLQRFGKFFVAAEKGGVPTFLMLESNNALEKAVNRLRATGFTITAQGFRGEGKAKDAPSGTFVAEVIGALDKAGVSEKTKDGIYQLYLQALPEMSMRKHAIHRQAVAGFDPDAIRAFAWNMHHGAHQLARLRYAHKLTGLRDDLVARQEEKRRMPDSDTRKITAGDTILDELGKRHEWLMNPQDSAVTAAVGAAGFIYYLGVTPAAALVNLSQTAIVSYPVLAARFGAIKAMNMLLGTMTTAIRTGGNLDRTLTDAEEIAAHRAMQEAGTFDKTQAHNLTGIAEGGSVNFSPKWAKAMQIIGYGFHITEVINREATAMAAFRLGRADGMTFNEALAFADKTVIDTHFDYTNANRARFMQSGAAKVLLMFRQYSLNMTWFLGRNLWNATKGEDPEVRRLARRQLAGVLGMTSLFAGTLGLPLMSVTFGVLNAVAATFGDDDEPWDAEVEFRNFLADLLGPEAASIITDGPVSALTGADFASRVSLSQLWFRDSDRELEGEGQFYNLLEQAAGPMGGVLKNVLVGKQRIDEGQVYRGVETMLPKSLKDGLKAARYATQGVNTMRGDPLVEDLSPWQSALQLAGFTPTEVARQYDANSATKGYEKKILDRRASLMDAYAMAYRLGDSDAMTASLAKIRAFNQAQPELAITAMTIRRSLQTRAKYSERAENGIVVNKHLAAKLNDVDRFAE